LKTRGCNHCQRSFNKVLSKGFEYLCKCDILNIYCILLNLQTKIKTSFCFCHYGIFCLDWSGGKTISINFRIML
jgi:hypothetical protein